MYARALVEMDISEKFSDEIHFTNEFEELVSQKVSYDWFPVLCSKCNQLGHLTEDYRVGAQKSKGLKPHSQAKGLTEVARQVNKGKQVITNSVTNTLPVALDSDNLVDPLPIANSFGLLGALDLPSDNVVQDPPQEINIALGAHPISSHG